MIMRDLRERVSKIAYVVLLFKTFRVFLVVQLRRATLGYTERHEATKCYAVLRLSTQCRAIKGVCLATPDPRLCDHEARFLLQLATQIRLRHGRHGCRRHERLTIHLSSRGRTTATDNSICVGRLFEVSRASPYLRETNNQLLPGRHGYERHKRFGRHGYGRHGFKSSAHPAENNVFSIEFLIEMSCEASRALEVRNRCFSQ